MSEAVIRRAMTWAKIRNVCEVAKAKSDICELMTEYELSLTGDECSEVSEEQLIGCVRSYNFQRTHQES